MTYKVKWNLITKPYPTNCLVTQHSTSCLFPPRASYARITPIAALDRTCAADFSDAIYFPAHILASYQLWQFFKYDRLDQDFLLMMTLTVSDRALLFIVSISATCFPQIIRPETLFNWVPDRHHLNKKDRTSFRLPLGFHCDDIKHLACIRAHSQAFRIRKADMKNKLVIPHPQQDKKLITRS